MGIDNINDYYDVRLKYGRLHGLGFHDGTMEWERQKVYSSQLFPHLRFLRMDLEDKEAVDHLFATEGFDRVVNMAAQAGVRYSISHPYAYLSSNLTGFLNILEACRNHTVKHLLFASSSSVYGLNEKVPFSEEDKADTPVSLYAATKRANELMAHSYAKLYGLPATGLRYFTVYGPWGRPDMAPMLFARAISKGEPIHVFNHGDMVRDFTFIDDIAKGSILCLDRMPTAENSPNGVPFRVFNIGCSEPVRLMDFIHEIETAFGKKARMEMKPMQRGDVYMTYADTTKLEHEIGYKPKTSLHEGIGRFIEWYQSGKNPLHPS